MDSALVSGTRLASGSLSGGPAWRGVTDADVEALMPIECGAYSHPWTRGNFHDSLAAGYLAELLIEPDAAAPLAYFVAMPVADELHLLNLTVAPAWQRQGLGRRALQRVLALARGRSLHSLWLEVRHSNLRARALYARAGLAEVGRRPDYYPAIGCREDAVLMRAVLAELPEAPAPCVRGPDALV